MYGGAITVELPQPYVDVSTMRQVPDNQEVFIFEGSSADSDESLIVDLIELEDKPMDQCIGNIVDDLVQTETVVTGPKLLHTTSNESLDNAPIYTYGVELENGVSILISVLRIQKAGTDLILSLNKKGDEETAVRLQRIESMGKSIRINDWGLFG